MQTNLADFIKDTPEGREADRILRSCVHCGFCTATCPTYQLLGDELDGPRGRIYLIKQVLEGTPATRSTQTHLDRCLTCRSCETTCPSGVQYGRLVDIGRKVVDDQVGRAPVESLKRRALATGLSNGALFGPALGVGRLAAGLLPSALAKKLPPKRSAGAWPAARHARRMVVLDGCVQPSLAPDINPAAARVLDRIGISLVKAPQAGCCGAVKFHLNYQDDGRDAMRRNVDAWIPLLDAGAEAIVMTASGCGATVREYGHLLEQDAAFAARAQRVADATRDLTEIVEAEAERIVPMLEAAAQGRARRALAFHSPCTLQHGQQIRGKAERMLTAAGFDLVPVADGHLCCGSAGTYSLLQPELSRQLLANKVAALTAGAPTGIATANIGCLTHLQSGTATPVRHWIEWLDDVLAGAARAAA
ncbi:MAG: glycolate oxidase subunit GlcF [Burkholderiales bacterium]|jgi:glycolate oxidase iron-sulfur subunit|nr:glycolate oxidase subunit GlcF [Burkholderiales bacterium]